VAQPASETTDDPGRQKFDWHVVGSSADRGPTKELAEVLAQERAVSRRGQPIVLVLGETLRCDPWLPGELLRLLDAGSCILPVLLGPSSGDVRRELPPRLRELHRLHGDSPQDPDLRAALREAIRLTPAEADSIGHLQVAARRWSDQPQNRRLLLPPKAALAGDDFWRGINREFPEIVDPIVRAYLDHSLDNVFRRARRRRWQVRAALVGLVGLVVTSAVVVHIERTAAARADQAASEQRSVQLAQESVTALTRGSEPEALEKVRQALGAANTRAAREAARRVVGSPWPDVVVQLPRQSLTAVAWTPTGRGVVVGTASGDLVIVDLQGLSRAGTVHGADASISTISVEAPARATYVDADGHKGSVDLPPAVGAWGTPVGPRAPARRAFLGRLFRNGITVTQQACPRDRMGPCSRWVSGSGGTVTAAAWSPTGERIAAVSSDGSIGVIDHIPSALAIAPATDVDARQEAARVDAEMGLAPKARRAVAVTSDQAVEISLKGVTPQTSVPVAGRCVSSQVAVPDSAGRSVEGYDCLGRRVWTVTLSQVMAGLPPDANVYRGIADSEPTGQPGGGWWVSDTGDRAIVLDINGTAHFLRRQGVWTSYQDVPLDLADGWAARGAAFDAYHDYAALGIQRSAMARPEVIVVRASDQRVFRREVVQADGSTWVQGVNGAGQVLLGGTKEDSDNALVIDAPRGTIYEVTDAGSQPVFSADGRQILTLSRSDPIHVWPEQFPVPSGSVATSTSSDRSVAIVHVAEIIDAATGEILCVGPVFDPQTPRTVSPSLSWILNDDLGQLLMDRLCSPILDPAAAVAARQSTIHRLDGAP
jgi:hypothetical protein